MNRAKQPVLTSSTAHALLKRLAPGTTVWTSSELSSLGIGAQARRQLIDSGGLLRIQRGAFALRDHAAALRGVERARLRLEAHQKVYARRRNRAFVYSHVSAARLHGCQMWHADEFVHVTFASRPNRYRSDSRTVAHYIPLKDAELTNHGQFSMTSLERTVVDCCRVLDLEGSLVVMDQALRRGADHRLLAGYAEKMRGHRGVVNLRQALELGDAKSESMGETRTRFLLWEMNISMPVSQFAVTTDRGIRRLDFAWPELKVALEFDGRIKYFGDVPTDEAIADERIRERRLMEMGWIFVRIDWKDLDDPLGVKHRIHAAWAKARLRPEA
ncbi:hypothetical protein [Arthrobacter sp. NPDC090010]|uniref:hypothetical protein n=1 Tax=Arthrobacter sp. NPDC090010 TaxID=3363942 RepID=UPI00381C5B1B